MKRTESSVGWMRPALTKCQRSSESAVAQPTHEPVLPWSPIFHQSRAGPSSWDRGGRRRQQARLLGVIEPPIAFSLAAAARS